MTIPIKLKRSFFARSENGARRTLYVLDQFAPHYSV